MKKTFLLLLFTFSICFSQEKETDTLKDITNKNEARIYYFYGDYTISLGLEYERTLKNNFAFSVFYRKGPEIEIYDSSFIELHGFGIKGIKYIRNYKSPFLWRAFFNDRRDIKSRPFIELAAAYALYQHNYTTKTLDNDNAYVLKRINELNNQFSLHAGIGLKYVFYQKVALQFALGLEAPFVSEPLYISPYFGFNAGYRF